MLGKAGKGNGPLLWAFLESGAAPHRALRRFWVWAGAPAPPGSWLGDADCRGPVSVLTGVLRGARKLLNSPDCNPLLPAGNDLEQVQEFELPNCICMVTLVACKKSARGGTSVPDNDAWHIPADLSVTAGSEEFGDYCSSSPWHSQSSLPTLPYP